MRIKIINYLKSLGFEISTLLDHRISHLSKFLPYDHMKIINSHETHLKKYKEFVRDTKYSFIIAPETSKILYDLTQIVKNYDKICLSSNLEGIKIGTSKINTYKFFLKNKILTPKTFLIPLKKNNLDIEFIIQKFYELEQPIIIKPEDGVGAESIYYFETKKQIENFFKHFKYKIEAGRNYVLQEFIDGRDLSISLINIINSLNLETERPYILSINSQYINIKSSNYKSEYLGGTTPTENHQKESPIISPTINPFFS